MPDPTRPRRPTIGVLAGWQVYERTTINWFLAALLQGVTQGARDLGCDLLLACGLGPRIDDPHDARPAWPALGEEVDFVPVGSWNTDGMLVLSPLRTEARREFARRLQAAGHPLVFVGAGDGRPSVEVDSLAGIRQALEHLRGHGHERIAFVAGDPLDAGDSTRRLDAFRRLMPELGLRLAETLVAHGHHSEQGGYDAMGTILGRGEPLTAVIASNDMSAIGAMRALAEAGLDVPGDVAVVGFDDHLMASAHVPPLTTVRYPLAQAGRAAVERLVEAIRGAHGLPETVDIPPLLVARRSCGCLPRDAAAPPAPAGAGGVDALVDEIASGMAAAAQQSGAVMRPTSAAHVCWRLANGLQQSLAEGAPAAFEAALIDLLQRLEAAGDRAHLWQPALSRLRQAVPRLLGKAPAASAPAAEELLHFARQALSESAERQGARQKVEDAELADRVSALAVPLQSAQNEGQILDLLARHAPPLGLRPACLALYEPASHDPVAWSRVLLLDGERPPPGSEGARLPTRGILPARLRQTADARCLAVLPLVHQQRARGFVALDADSLEPCAAIVRPLASALESVRLQAAVRALTFTDELTGLHNRRFFEQELRRETERARRFGRRVALVMIDVDHFKVYNDRFGHRAGDDALRGVAACLVGAAARRVDAVTRYGGEEFAVLLAETDLAGARFVAERVREVVAESREFLCPLTVSAGVAALEGEAAEAETLVVQADEALYQAKREGRNCVCVAG